MEERWGSEGQRPLASQGPPSAFSTAATPRAATTTSTAAVTTTAATPHLPGLLVGRRGVEFKVREPVETRGTRTWRRNSKKAKRVAVVYDEIASSAVAVTIGRQLHHD
eukprot:GHVT01015945.1.p2 GENE.GHVT01015945.1~~GHVT01015945.1.p2  ORF type:complete len:108 (+),score=16.88 GHVT01015945.1:235-558(+)